MAQPIDVILGPPGSGKTEQANRLEASRAYVHLSTGALLRASADPEIVDIMNRGELVPSPSVEKLLLERLKALQPNLAILLDGFPRDKDEMKWLDQSTTELNRPLGRAIYLTVPKAEAVARLLKRGRPDDTEAALIERFDEYEKETRPVIDYYRKRNLLIEVDGTGTPEEVATRIEQSL